MDRGQGWRMPQYEEKKVNMQEKKVIGSVCSRLLGEERIREDI